MRSAVLLAVLCAFVAAKTCKYDSGDFNAHWLYANNSISLQFQNTNIKNNHWTGLAFGDEKNNLQGIFFMVSNNQVSVRTGSTTEHGPPTFSSNGTNSAISTQSLLYFPRDKTLSAVVTIPLQFNGRSLQNCQKWNWIKSGKIENGVITRNSKSPKDKKTSFLLLATVGFASSATCNYSKSAVKASWKIVDNGALQIQYQNTKISNNQWTAIGFGPGMQSQSVIVIMVQNGQITVRTGRTTGFAAPAFDSQTSVSVQTANLSGTTINVLITVPLSFNGMNLQDCQTWNFVQTGPITNGQMGAHTSVPDQVNNVCASQCR
ncbi:unnamed protein product [Caenorhabditis sp. 36 PRJEB53466]|nr:unnamed protein product [Caenorhabditis sp. 36 PRJEB53466]